MNEINNPRYKIGFSDYKEIAEGQVALLMQISKKVHSNWWNRLMWLMMNVYGR